MTPCICGCPFHGGSCPCGCAEYIEDDGTEGPPLDADDIWNRCQTAYHWESSEALKGDVSL